MATLGNFTLTSQTTNVEPVEPIELSISKKSKTINLKYSVF